MYIFYVGSERVNGVLQSTWGTRLNSATFSPCAGVLSASSLSLHLQHASVTSEPLYPNAPSNIGIFLFDLFLFLFCCLKQGYIDASEDGFKKFADDGEELINANHYASEEIREKVSF